MPQINSSPNFEQSLLEKIRRLSPEGMIEVEDFVDFLLERRDASRLTLAATTLSENAFATVWDNSEDEVYDDL
ncbi:toxin-antitoxin system, antitoxin component, Xre family protein [Laspinema palackyanum]|uniref:toxin-antitoxin system, antitoxin component, Xre family protein n=1 Tax=Laspinema palackyanum TaxID=3231601 RepID=UPI00345C960C|nr:DUF2281 domain-containing protein [Laspinema sp. D2c]